MEHQKKTTGKKQRLTPGATNRLSADFSAAIIGAESHETETLLKYARKANSTF